MKKIEFVIQKERVDPKETKELTINNFFSIVDEFTKTKKSILVHPPSLLEYDINFFNTLVEELKRKIAFTCTGLTELSVIDQFVIDLLSDCH